MNMKQCINGHFYDMDKTEYCPYCSDQTMGITRPLNHIPVTGHQPNANHFPSTVPLQEDYFPKTVGLSSNEQISVTLPLNMGANGIVPILSWLVCIDGKKRGKDYSIHTDRCYIGRLPSNDICLDFEETLSRESQILLLYNNQKKEFWLDQTHCKNNIYINHDLLFQPTRLNSKDMIGIGSTQFVFIPFCDSKFSWT